jgi:hypothetical protein
LFDIKIDYDKTAIENVWSLDDSKLTALRKVYNLPNSWAAVSLSMKLNCTTRGDST